LFNEDTRVISEETAGSAICERMLVIIGAGGFGAIVLLAVN